MNYLGMILENALPRTSTGSYNNFNLKTTCTVEPIKLWKTKTSFVWLCSSTKGWMTKIWWLLAFPKDFSKVSTSQGYFPKWQLPKCAISQFCPCHSDRPPLKPAAPQRAWLILRELDTWTFVTWENAFRKVPNTNKK